MMLSCFYSYLSSAPKRLGVVLRFCVTMALFISSACTQNTTNNQTNPPTSQASGNTRTSDPDGWGGGGTGDGGGGQGVYCSADAKDSKLRNRLMVRDVYEAEYNYRRGMLSGSYSLGAAGTETVDEATINFLIMTLKRHFGPMMLSSDFGSAKFWKDFAKGIAFVPDDASLYPSQDANSPLALPKGCKIVQIAYWDESGLNDNGTLYVDKSYWTKLDQFNKAALLAHEYFFKRARSADFKNSDYVRYKVGQLFSTEGLPALFPDWEASKDSKLYGYVPASPVGFKYCVGKSSEPDAELKLYQYEDSKGLQQVVVPEIKVSGFVQAPFQSTSFSFERNQSTFALSMVMDSFISREDRDLYAAEFMNPRRWGLTGLGLEGKGLNLYSAPIKAKNGNGKLSILNPMTDATDLDTQELKSREELVVLMNQKIEKILHEGLKGLRYSNADVLGPVNVLNSEIDEAIRSGVYPTGFPRWTAALKALESKSYEVPTFRGAGSIPNKLTLENPRNIYSELPEALFRFKVGNYNRLDVKGSIGVDGFKNSKSKVEGVVNVLVNNKSVDFTLSCWDYAASYQQITKEPVQIELFKPFEMNKNIQINRQDLQLNEELSPNEKNVFPLIQQLHEKLKDLMSSGKLNIPEERTAFMLFADATCVNPDRAESAQDSEICRPVLEFIKDMSVSKDVSLEACEGSLFFEGNFALPSVIIPACIQFNFRDVQRKYNSIIVMKTTDREILSNPMISKPEVLQKLNAQTSNRLSMTSLLRIPYVTKKSE